MTRTLAEELADLGREVQNDSPALADRLIALAERATVDAGGGRYVTTGEAAARLGVSPNTVKKWVRLGIIQKFWTLPGSGYLKIDRSEVERLLAENAASPNTEGQP